MRLTLERAELVQLIGKSLGYEIVDEDVTVKAEPFEVLIKNVDLGGLANATTSAAEFVPAYVEEDPGEDETDRDIAENVLTMSDILNQNTEMGGAGALTDKAVGAIPKRPLGPNEFEEAPPIDAAELAAVMRTSRQ